VQVVEHVVVAEHPSRPTHSVTTKSEVRIDSP
jgi:hypothetical protein